VPACALPSSHPGFPDMDYPGESLKITLPGFAWGALAPVWSYGEVLALASSHS
jgi:hypothetical protein